MPLQSWSGVELDLDLLHPKALPAAFALDCIAAASLLLAAVIYVAANARRFRAHEA